jgi:uncharacterized protein (DUF885 family)
MTTTKLISKQQQNNNKTTTKENHLQFNFFHFQLRRYINRPGQGTSYLVGYFYIKEIRKKREKALKGNT